ncbi:MAG: hypothetical protein HIU91_16240 [Acidobacteria bacterium]|nr:hypothetical protein [Acidobacteriota bacterium]
MTPIEQLALEMLELMEYQVVELVALRAVLAREADFLPDWKEEVETAKILVAGKVHQAFETLRARCGEVLDSNQPPIDLDSVVRRVLSSLQADEP